MPLRDHFRPPLSEFRAWESFHAAWAVEIMRHFNLTVLPRRCFAQTQVHIGGRVEVDVGTFDREDLSPPISPNGDSGVAVEAWAPPTATAVMAAVFPDEIEIQVFETSSGATLVGAIELVSPANKDRPDTRRAFAAKCASYLQQGIGLVVIDAVTNRLGNLHNELIRLMDRPAILEFPADAPLYATAYRPVRTETADQIEIWAFPLAVGQALPIAPLHLRGLLTVPVDLETTYMTACHDSRI